MKLKNHVPVKLPQLRVLLALKDKTVIYRDLRKQFTEDLIIDLWSMGLVDLYTNNDVELSDAGKALIHHGRAMVQQKDKPAVFYNLTRKVEDGSIASGTRKTPYGRKVITICLGEFSLMTSVVWRTRDDLTPGQKNSLCSAIRKGYLEKKADLYAPTDLGANILKYQKPLTEKFQTLKTVSVYVLKNGQIHLESPDQPRR